MLYTTHAITSIKNHTQRTLKGETNCRQGDPDRNICANNVEQQFTPRATQGQLKGNFTGNKNLGALIGVIVICVQQEQFMLTTNIKWNFIVMAMQKINQETADQLNFILK